MGSLRKKQVFLVAIVGGSGSGKSWLADKLKATLGRSAARLSLDDFYRDRSHLSVGRRAKLNFDSPRAIDWQEFEKALRSLAEFRPTPVPSYDFATHSRLPAGAVLNPKPIVLVEGLWLLHRPTVRKLFDFRIYVDCPAPLRLKRRLARDLQTRGRTRASILAQFRNQVEPMHGKYVGPQARWADLVLREDCEATSIKGIAAELRERIDR